MTDRAHCIQIAGKALATHTQCEVMGEHHHKVKIEYIEVDSLSQDGQANKARNL